MIVASAGQPGCQLSRGECHGLGRPAGMAPPGRDSNPAAPVGPKSRVARAQWASVRLGRSYSRRQARPARGSDWNAAARVGVSESI